MLLRGWLGDGRDVYIENHENRFADMENGRKADGQSERGRPARFPLIFPPAGRAA
jgi:hypothetical protein